MCGNALPPVLTANPNISEPSSFDNLLAFFNSHSSELSCYDRDVAKETDLASFDLQALDAWRVFPKSRNIFAFRQHLPLRRCIDKFVCKDFLQSTRIPGPHRLVPFFLCRFEVRDALTLHLLYRRGDCIGNRCRGHQHLEMTPADFSEQTAASTCSVGMNAIDGSKLDVSARCIRPVHKNRDRLLINRKRERP